MSFNQKSLLDPEVGVSAKAGTDAQTHGFGDSMSHLAQRADSVKAKF